MDAGKEGSGDFGGTSRDAREKEHEVVLELLPPLLAQGDGVDENVPVLVEDQLVESSVGDSGLVLGAYVFGKDALLDFEAFFEESMGADVVSLVRVKRLQQASYEGGAGAHAAAGGQVCVVVDLEPVLDAEVPHDCGDDGVFDFIEGLGLLDFRVNDLVVVFEEGGEFAAADVAVFVDGAGQGGSAVLAVPGWVVGASTEKGNAERGLRYDHPIVKCSRLLDMNDFARGKLLSVPMSRKGASVG